MVEVGWGVGTGEGTPDGARRPVTMALASVTESELNLVLSVAAVVIAEETLVVFSRVVVKDEIRSFTDEKPVADAEAPTLKLTVALEVGVLSSPPMETWSRLHSSKGLRFASAPASTPFSRRESLADISKMLEALIPVRTLAMAVFSVSKSLSPYWDEFKPDMVMEDSITV